MGAYLYSTSPKLTARALVGYPDGTSAEVDVALYLYRYKPWTWDEKANRRLHFRCGAAACDAAYRRSGKAVPALGICADGDRREVYALDGLDASPGLFLTRGESSVLDDYTKPGGVVLAWVTLPKGWSVKPPRLSATA